MLQRFVAKMNKMLRKRWCACFDRVGKRGNFAILWRRRLWNVQSAVTIKCHLIALCNIILSNRGISPTEYKRHDNNNKFERFPSINSRFYSKIEFLSENAENLFSSFHACADCWHYLAPLDVWCYEIGLSALLKRCNWVVIYASINQFECVKITAQIDYNRLSPARFPFHFQRHCYFENWLAWNIIRLQSIAA